MVGADDTTELWRPPLHNWFLPKYFIQSSHPHPSLTFVNEASPLSRLGKALIKHLKMTELMLPLSYDSCNRLREPQVGERERESSERMREGERYLKIYRRERENSVSEESVREKNRYFEEN